MALCDFFCRQVKNVGVGVRYSKQLFMSLFDLEMHGAAFHNHLLSLRDGKKGEDDQQAALDDQAALERLEELWARRRKETTMLSNSPGTFLPASWYHPVMGYDCGYYGYAFAEVFAYDMFSRFEASPGGCFDAVEGRRFRKCVLEPGATQDGEVMLRTFLERDPNDAAFLRHVGVSIPGGE